jgi:hypothetical protein
MNINHDNYIIYCRILEDMYDETHIFGNKFTNDDYIKNLKYYGIYSWYLKEERKEKLQKINENNELHIS